MELAQLKREVNWYTAEIRTNERDVAMAERVADDAKRKVELLQTKMRENKRKLEQFTQEVQRGEQMLAEQKRLDAQKLKKAAQNSTQK